MPEPSPAAKADPAADEETEWYAADPRRKARIDALPAPTGDACAVVQRPDEEVLTVGGVPVFFPFDAPGTNRQVAVAVGEFGSVTVMNHRVGDRLFVGFSDRDRTRHLMLVDDGNGSATYLTTVLWAVDCAHPRRRPERYYVAPEAEHDWIDFGLAVPSLEGDALYVTSSFGVSRLVLASRVLEEVLPTMRCTPEEAASDDDRKCWRVLIPERMTEAGLQLIAGIPEQNCHGAGPDLVRYIVDLASDRRRDAHTWVQPGTVMAFASAGRALLLGHHGLWRSTDEGRSWSRVAIAIPDGDGKPSDIGADVSRLVVDAQRTSRVLMLSERMPTPEGPGPSALFRSEDAGAHWRLVPLEDGAPILDLWSVDGSLARLAIVRGEPRSNQSATTLETRDGGKTWSASQAVPPSRPLDLPTGFAVTPLGLWRTDEGSRTLVFPPPHLHPPMWIDRAPLTPAVPREPIDWDAWDRAATANQRGLSLAKAGRLDEAIEAYTDAWKANSNSAVARYNAACAHARAGRPKEAMALLEELHRRGGFRALQLLAAAATDPDLASLAKLARFRVLTTATAPSSAYDHSFIHDIDFDIGTMVMSDPHERLCLWVTEVAPQEGRVPFELERFDCSSGAAKGRLGAATNVELADILDDLGMVGWAPIDADSPDHAKVEAWVGSQAKAIAQREVQGVYRSPSGKLVAARVEGSGDEGVPPDGVLVGTWPH